jgi:hypothetical protein
VSKSESAVVFRKCFILVPPYGFLLYFYVYR